MNHIGRRLVAVCERPDLNWTIRVLDSRELNAFSVPGYVYITTATLNAMRDDQDAIAGVLAHEIGHTCGKHAAKQMEKGAIGSLLVGLIGGRNRTVGSLANVAANLVMLGYSRDDENDADRRAVRYTTKAGWQPVLLPPMAHRGRARVLPRLARVSRCRRPALSFRRKSSTTRAAGWRPDP